MAPTLHRPCDSDPGPRALAVGPADRRGEATADLSATGSGGRPGGRPTGPGRRLGGVSVTRLLVLGAVRIFQPAHGYLIRRELVSWQADQWAHLNPGSVYNALRTLAKDGLLIDDTVAAPDGPGSAGRAATSGRAAAGAGGPVGAAPTPPAPAPTAAGSGPASAAAKVSYRLTDDGETEFQRLVRVALWELHPFEPEWLLAGQSFWAALSRDEVLAALAARATQLQGRIVATEYAAAAMGQSPFKPVSVVEHFFLHIEQVRGELAWVDAVRSRIEGGAYWFDGEPGHAIPALDDRLDTSSSTTPGIDQR